jgi:hypothetical protein
MRGEKQRTSDDMSLHASLPCHFTLHFINQVLENPGKMIVIRAQGNRSAIFKRLRGRNSAENVLS